MRNYEIQWVLNDSNFIHPVKYTCAYCDSIVASNIGIFGRAILPVGRDAPMESICICANCSRPTYLPAVGGQVPARLPSQAVAHLPQNMEILFTEARRAVSVGANTAAVMLCRTILMHIAVGQQAPIKNDRGKSPTFKEYVDYLVEKHLIPHGARSWVDKIREMGNEAVHELVIMNSNDAELMLEFTTLLLQMLYETHGKMQKRFGQP